jgi:hypothetical protein
MVIQSVILPKKNFTKSSAIKWIKDHKYIPNFHGKGVDITKNTFRFRQKAPSKIVPSSYKTQSIARGIKLVVGKKR